MAKTCETHPSVPAVAECMQCRKRLCVACTVVTPAGRFCSPPCSTQYRDRKEKAGTTGSRRYSSVVAVLCVVLVFIAGVLFIHLEARGLPEGHWVQKIDLLGRYMKREQ